MAGCVPQPHTCGTPVYLTLFFSLLRRCRLTAQGIGEIKQGHSSAFPPSAEECMLPFASSSRTQQKVENLPRLPTACTIGPTPGPGIWTTLQWDPAIPSRSPPLRVQSLGQASVLNTAFPVSVQTPAHTVPPHNRKPPISSLTMDTPRCLPSPGHSSSAVGASTPFCMLCLQCFFCVPHAHHLHAILFHPSSPVTC